MVDFLRRMFARPAASPEAAEAPPSPLEALAPALVTLAVELWRLRGRLARLSEAERSPLRRVETSLDKMGEALGWLGIAVEDPAGRPWDERDPVKVLVFEPVAGLGRAQVVETVKPVVFLGDRLLAPGEVVVGTPPEGTGDGRP